MRFGLDHWGQRLTLGPPVALDYAHVHALTLILGSVFPPSAHPGWRERLPGAHARLADLVEVRLGDLLVLSARVPAYPATPSQVVLGHNEVGASNCRREFSG